jgi:hypothetical protein
MTGNAKRMYRIFATASAALWKELRASMPQPPPASPFTTLALPPTELLQRLREMRRSAQEHDVESSSVRANWLDAVDALLRVLRGWLERAVVEGLVRIDIASVHVPDDAVGAYDAPALKITLPSHLVVWVRPVGTLCVGARGIVDVVCGSNRALLVLNRAGVWKIRGVGPSSALAPLDENAFARALMELIL